MTLRLERGERVWEVRLDRPHRANALSDDLVEDLLAVLDKATGHDLDALVLHGNDRHFAAGFDLGSLPEESDATLALRFLRIGVLLERVQAAPFLTVAVVEGHAVGAGADLALACDHRIGTADARLRFPGARFGVVLGMARLVQLAGPDTARALASGATLDAVSAHAHGVLTEVSGAPDAAVRRLVEAWATVEPHARLSLLTQLRPPHDHDTALAALARSVATPGLWQRLTTYAGAARTRTTTQESR